MVNVKKRLGICANISIPSVVELVSGKRRVVVWSNFSSRTSPAANAPRALARRGISASLRDNRRR